MLSRQPEVRVFSGICPDEACQTKLFFPSYAASSVECTGCGKHFTKGALHSVQVVEDSNEAMRNLLRSLLLTSTLRKGTDLVKVRGYSNYHCRILSPILTYYGMEKSSSRAKLLREMGQGEFFDCFHVGDRAFSIEPEYLETPGYGKDKSGASGYLHEMLEQIKLVNENDERLVPLHVDGDGYCLVHAISRALIGREIFWHALMVNLQNHLKKNISQYKNLFVDFISHDEWDLIIAEADPEYKPLDEQPLGLRNIHIFGLANVLHRPILLLDSVSGIQSSADYSGTFLPALVPVHLCKTKDSKCIPPLAVAWSNSGRNHFIPLVGIRNKPLANIPSWVIPKAWGIPNELVKEYIDFDEQRDVCVIGGTKVMSDAYLSRLMKSMDDKFLEINKISASLVTEVHQFIFKPSGLVGVRPKTVIERTQQTVESGLLMRCLSCKAVSEYTCPVNQEWLLPGGCMYQTASNAAQAQGGLTVEEKYSFPEHHVVCTYNSDKDVLEVATYKGVDVNECVLCKGSLRKVKEDGSPIYHNGDRTTTPVTGPSSRCSCGYKHYWDGIEYDNQPELLPISLDWGGISIKEKVHWFQYESNPSLNSNVYAVAWELVQKYFPGEFGSERLVQKVVDIILRQTARKEGENKGARPDIPNLGAAPSQSEDPMMYCSSKIILTGQKKKTFHKEELNMSDAERRVKTKTEHHAAVTQNRQTRQQKTPEKSQAKTQPTKQETSPSSPKPTSSQAPRNNKRIRLSSSTGGQHDLTLPLNVTYSQLQEAIEKELGVPPKDQKIRFGFPPRLLHPPDEGKEQEPIPVQHGERVMVEVLPPPKPEPQPKEIRDIPEENKMDIAGAMGGETKSSIEETSKDSKTEQSPMDVDVDTAALASALMSALSGALPNDMWEMACRTPHMFDYGGYYYNMAISNLGTLKDDQHCTFPNLPNKMFAYNKAADRLDLCLGDIHLPVQPINQETLAQGQRSSHSSQSSVMNTLSSFSGAITHRNSNRSTMAFTGEGRSLVDSSKTSTTKQEKQETPKSDNGTIDISAETATSTATPELLEATFNSPQTEENKRKTDNEASSLVAMETDQESDPKPLDQNNEGEVPKDVSMEANQASEPTLKTDQNDKQNPFVQAEQTVSPQASSTAGTAIVVMETTQDNKEDSLPGEKEPGPADVAMVPSDHGLEEIENVASPDTMEIETEIPRDDPRVQDAEVLVTETIVNTIERQREGSRDSQTGISRDDPRDQDDEASARDVNVNREEIPKEGLRADETKIPRDEHRDQDDEAAARDVNINTDKIPREGSRDDQTGIPLDQDGEALVGDLNVNTEEIPGEGLRDDQTGIPRDQDDEASVRDLNVKIEESSRDDQTGIPRDQDDEASVRDLNVKIEESSRDDQTGIPRDEPRDQDGEAFVGDVNVKIEKCLLDGQTGIPRDGNSKLSTDVTTTTPAATGNPTPNMKKTQENVDIVLTASEGGSVAKETEQSVTIATADNP